MIIKVCGMREPENIRAVERTGADMMGFIFYPPSKRYVAKVPEYLPHAQKRVGVFVNSSKDEILRKAKLFALDYIQLQGDESPEFCNALKGDGMKLIRAVPVADADDIIRAADFEMADFLLFDTKTPKRGGSGKTFNWDVLSSYRGKTPFLLSGGINPDSLSAVLSFVHPRFAGIDLNSGFELSPALKDAALIKRFIANIRSLGALTQ